MSTGGPSQVVKSTSSTPGEERAETGGMDEGAGVGQAGAAPGSALRKCNLAAQSQTDAQSRVPAGSGKGADGQGQRAIRADLFQGLQEQLPVIEQAIETAALM